MDITSIVITILFLIYYIIKIYKNIFHQDKQIKQIQRYSRANKMLNNITEIQTRYKDDKEKQNFELRESLCVLENGTHKYTNDVKKYLIPYYLEIIRFLAEVGFVLYILFSNNYSVKMIVLSYLIFLEILPITAQSIASKFKDITKLRISTFMNIIDFSFFLYILIISIK